MPPHYPMEEKKGPGGSDASPKRLSAGGEGAPLPTRGPFWRGGALPFKKGKGGGRGGGKSPNPVQKGARKKGVPGAGEGGAGGGKGNFPPPKRGGPKPGPGQRAGGSLRTSQPAVRLDLTPPPRGAPRLNPPFWDTPRPRHPPNPRPLPCPNHDG